MTRRFFILATLSLIVLTAVAASQPWLTLDMKPDGKSVELARIDGFALHSWLAVVLTFIMLASFMAIYVSKGIRTALLIVSGLTSAIASFAIGLATARAETATVQSTIDNAVNIASAHDIGAEAINYFWSLFAQSWILFALLTAWMIFAALKSSNWIVMARTERTSGKRSSASKSTDPISLWESQR